MQSPKEVKGDRMFCLDWYLELKLSGNSRRQRMQAAVQPQRLYKNSELVLNLDLAPSQLHPR
jgi:hypothetical protein